MVSVAGIRARLALVASVLMLFHVVIGHSPSESLRHDQATSLTIAALCVIVLTVASGIALGSQRRTMPAPFERRRSVRWRPLPRRAARCPRASPVWLQRFLS
jgi:hypothetical protein